MFHEQWKSILDDEFVEAYLHGIVIECLDGVTRRFYPVSSFISVTTLKSMPSTLLLFWLL